MKTEDIEFLIHAMDCLNSPNMEVVKSFRNDKDSIKRLVELASLNREDLFKVIDRLKGGVTAVAELAFDQFEFDTKINLTVENYDTIKQVFIEAFTKGRESA